MPEGVDLAAGVRRLPEEQCSVVLPADASAATRSPTAAHATATGKLLVTHLPR